MPAPIPAVNPSEDVSEAVSEHPLFNLGTEIAAGIGRQIGEGLAVMAEALKGIGKR